MLKMAEPRCTCSVMAEQWPRKASGPGMCEYSSRKWCCGHHTYLKWFWSAAFAISTLRMMRLCSAFGSASRSNLGTNSWAKTPNSMGLPPCGQTVENIDRKSVVKGKRVTVDVDLGGRSII